MRAPKTPVSTMTPSARNVVQKRSYSGSASSGEAAEEKLGRFPRAVSASSVNWLTTSAEPPESRRERSNLPASFSKMRSFAILDRQTIGVAFHVPRRDTEQDAEPGADRAAGDHRSAADPLDDGFHSPSRSRMRAA